MRGSCQYAWLPTAIHQFFVQNAIPYRQVAPHRYESERLTLLNMDFFGVTPDDTGHVEAPTLPGHRMVEKFNLAFLKEHGFWLHRTA